MSAAGAASSPETCSGAFHPIECDLPELFVLEAAEQQPRLLGDHGGELRCRLLGDELGQQAVARSRLTAGTGVSLV
jgi:hypothetical protein